MHLIKLYIVYMGYFLEPEINVCLLENDRNDSGFYCICSFTMISSYIMQDNGDSKTLKFCLASV